MMRRGALERDWTKGSIIGNLLSLGWPMVVGSSLNMLGPTIDMIWVGKLGAAAIAGVGISGMVVMLVNSMMMGLFQGLRAMVARFIGAGDAQGANHVAQQSLVISVAYSITTAVIGILFAERILILMGVGPDVVTQGAPYLRINFIGMVTMTFRNMTEATMQASGDSKRPMWVAIFFRLFHVALSPFLIFGWWLFPRLGVSGAAVTNVFSQGIGATLGLWFLFSGRTRLRLTLSNFRIDPVVIWRLVKLAFPASITSMERTLGNLVMVRFMTPFGTLAVAAHTLHQRVEMFLNMPQMGIGQAAGVLAGQNLGAGQPERAERTGWIGVSFLSGVMLVASLAVFLWAENIIHIFNSDPELVKLASIFLRIAVASYILMGINASLQQSITGAGDTFVPMIIMLLNMWLVQVPLAFFLPQVTGLGVLGVRWAIVAGTAAAAIAYVIYFKLGRWKYKKV
ncbi:MAG: MATE family efflux transporter [Chloroflexi bacterium]|nr:MATE family efflux transporter [Chloroflexota bacterium]